MTVTLLQGTDGIRGRIQYAPPTDNATPLDFFLKTGLLTPDFFECYTYAYAGMLLENGSAQPGDTIIVGWDPRDTEGSFNQAALSGIRKAGLSVTQVGILPTPAIPLYMLSQKAVGSVVLTASHNPSDQNGIKLFWGATGLKFLPGDDKALSERIFDQNQLILSDLPLKGNIDDHTTAARQQFISFCSHSQNSWIDNPDFSDTVLILDASKGAVAGVLENIFEHYSFHEILMTDMSGAINESCGVADLEGREVIDASEVEPVGSQFHDYETLRLFFETAGSTPEIQSGTRKLTGLVFDGDGDRRYRLDFLPETQQILISSGDYLGIHQARYLLRYATQPVSQPLFVNTVESDLNTAISAENSGYQPVLTGVGDKWILLKAVSDMISGSIDPDTKNGSRIISTLQELKQSSEPSGLEISKQWRDYNSEESLLTSPAFRFQIGLEESGHCITPGFIHPGDKTPFFAGNGIKTGLNSLQAVRDNFIHKPQNDWSGDLKSPYPGGIVQTRYIYYVDKQLILPGTEFRETLKAFLMDQMKKFLPAELTSEIIEFPEERPLLYCRISDEGKMKAAVFIRNSGTEDKSAVYLRGEKNLSSPLEQIGSAVHLFLLTHLKNKADRFAQFEAEILTAIQTSQVVESAAKSYADLPLNRVLKEMELKEGLIRRNSGDWELTETGIQLMAKSD